MTYFTGIDIGSTSAKTIVMDDKQNICLRMLQPTGWSCIDTAGEILRKLEAEGIKRESMKIVATGYGRAEGEHCLRVVDSIVNKVAAQAGKLSIGTGTVCLTGGLCGITLTILFIFSCTYGMPRMRTVPSRIRPWRFRAVLPEGVCLRCTWFLTFHRTG